MDRTIVIVDDEPDIRTALAFYLESLDHFKIYQASSGNEALSLLSKTDVDLVISDIRMPQGDGLFLIEQLKDKIAKGLKFIFMTGYSDLSKKQAIQLGAQEIFHKPFDLNALGNYILEQLK